MAEHTYRLHWLSGDTQDVRGPDPATAMNNAGIGHGALPALDYYECVDSKPDERDRLRALNAEMLAFLESLPQYDHAPECQCDSCRALPLIAKAKGQQP